MACVIVVLLQLFPITLYLLTKRFQSALTMSNENSLGALESIGEI